MTIDDVVDKKPSLKERIKDYIMDYFETNYLKVSINGTSYVEDDYTEKRIEGDMLYFNHPAPGASAEWDADELASELINILKEDKKEWDKLTEIKKSEYVDRLFVYDKKTNKAQ